MTTQPLTKPIQRVTDSRKGEDRRRLGHFEYHILLSSRLFVIEVIITSTLSYDIYLAYIWSIG